VGERSTTRGGARTEATDPDQDFFLHHNPAVSLLPASMPTPTAELYASIEKHNETFESLLKLIPARYYLVQEETEEQVRSSSCR
jgi:hypothetical protein